MSQTPKTVSKDLDRLLYNPEDSISAVTLPAAPGGPGGPVLSAGTQAPGAPGGLAFGLSQIKPGAPTAASDSSAPSAAARLNAVEKIYAGGAGAAGAGAGGAGGAAGNIDTIPRVFEKMGKNEIEALMMQKAHAKAMAKERQKEQYRESRLRDLMSRLVKRGYNMEIAKDTFEEAVLTQLIEQRLEGKTWSEASLYIRYDEEHKNFYGHLFAICNEKDKEAKQQFKQIVVAAGLHAVLGKIVKMRIR